MALYTNLPVYKLGYNLLIAIHKQTKNFSREHKYTLGEKLKEATLQVIIYVYKANKTKKVNRIEYIDLAREQIETIRLLWRIAKDLNVTGNKTYININITIEELSKQLTAWQKYTARATA